MATTVSTPSLLAKLQLENVNQGASAGADRWISDPDAQELVSYNPATGEPIARVLQASAEAYDEVVGDAAAAFQSWRMTPPPRRGELVRDLGNALREMKEPLGDLVSLEMGKIRAEGHGEVQEMIDICDFATGLSRQLYGLTMGSERPGHRMMEQWHPLGVVGVITAFNFPVAVWAWNSAIAAVCGDPVVWKPAAPTPLCAVAVQHIANRVMADHGVRGVFTLAIGAGRTVGERMLNDRRLPLISFTGSTQVGEHVAATVAKRFGRTILELGGNNAIIVTEDADLDLATRAILFGAVGTAGQRCTSTRRIIAQKTIAGELVERLVRAYKQVRIGDPLDPSTLMGPLVTPDALTDMFAAHRSDQDRGGRDRRRWWPARRSRAAVRGAHDRPHARAERHRQGGDIRPCACTCSSTTRFEEALSLHNDVPQGLSSAIFTESMRKAEEFLSAKGSDCGIANVNIGTSAQRSAERSAARRRRAAGASRAPIRGRRTCAGRPTR